MTPTLAFATYLILALGLFGLFARGDRRVDEDTRRAITRWLGRRGGDDEVATQAATPHDWAHSFLNWFDRVFGVRKVALGGVELYLPRLWRSVVASFLALLVLSIVWLLHKETMSRPLRFGDPIRGNWDQFSLLVLLYGSATLITNWIPDYLSLIQSRWIMQRMAAATSRVVRLGWLVLDAVLTAGIAFVAIFVGMKLVLPFVENQLTVEIGCFSSELFGLDDAWRIFVSGIRFETPPGTLNYDASGIYIYSTFMTSLWVWVYGLVGLAVRGVAMLGGTRVPGSEPSGSLREVRPLLVMGLVAVVGFTGVFWTTWLVEGARRADVAVVYGSLDRDRVESLVPALESEGLRVLAVEVPPVDISSVDAEARELDAKTRADLERSLERAELVIVVDRGGPFSSLGDSVYLREALEVTRAQVDRNARPSGTMWIWSPWVYEGVTEDGVRAAVDWAKRAPSLLGFEQLEVCRERWPDGRPRRHRSR